MRHLFKFMMMMFSNRLRSGAPQMLFCLFVKYNKGSSILEIRYSRINLMPINFFWFYIYNIKQQFSQHIQEKKMSISLLPQHWILVLFVTTVTHICPYCHLKLSSTGITWEIRPTKLIINLDDYCIYGEHALLIEQTTKCWVIW